jgi:hypothetical protein
MSQPCPVHRSLLVFLLTTHAAKKARRHQRDKQKVRRRQRESWLDGISNTDPKIPPININPAVPPANGVCHFNQLSAELRSMIYNYAFRLDDKDRPAHLKEQLGRICVCIEVNQEGGGTMSVEANQLRFVNKQIGREMMAYISRYMLENSALNIWTTRPGAASPLAFAATYLPTVPPDWLSKLSIISIRRMEAVEFSTINQRSDLYYDFDAQAKLFGFCRQYPHLTVH